MDIETKYVKDRIQQIEARLSNAAEFAPGVWYLDDRYQFRFGDPYGLSFPFEEHSSREVWEFFVMCREDVPFLLDEIERLRNTLEEQSVKRGTGKKD